jgi:hypothetical protein
VPRSLSTRRPSMRVVRAESSGGRGISATLRNRTCIVSRCVFEVEIRWTNIPTTPSTRMHLWMPGGNHTAIHTPRGGEAIAEPTPLERTAPGRLAGGAVAAPCRPPRKATGPVDARGCSKFDRTLRCARDPCPADGLAPPGCARPRRQPLVRVAPGSTQESCCRTSRLSTPRARDPVLAAGARTRDMRGQVNARIA